MIAAVKLSLKRRLSKLNFDKEYWGVIPPAPRRRRWSIQDEPPCGAVQLHAAQPYRYRL